MKIGIIDLCKQIEDPRMNRKKVLKNRTSKKRDIQVVGNATNWV